MEGRGDVRYRPLSVERRVVIDFLGLGERHHMMHALLEFDVTDAREKLEAHRRRTGEKISFTAYLCACLGRALVGRPEMHCLLDRWGHLVLFDTVDITTIVEIDGPTEKFPMAHVLRGCHRRSVIDLHDELRRVQADPEASVNSSRWRALNYFYILPSPLRRVVYRAVTGDPVRLQRLSGTVSVSALGMFGRPLRWGIGHPTIHNLNFTIGGIVTRPVMREGSLEEREFLLVTASMNHDIMDGAPAARFVESFREQLEGGVPIDLLGGRDP